MMNRARGKQHTANRNAHLPAPPSPFLLSRRCGFTLVETLVAITILTLAMGGAFFVANSSIVAARIARDQLIASLLAQEGIEYVRALRDDAYLAAYASGGMGAWTNFLTAVAPCSGTGTCTLDPTRPLGVGAGYALQPCAGSCTPLFLSATGMYTQQTGGTPTPFTRSVSLASVSVNEETVTSSVTWMDHTTPYTITITDHLTPWQ